MRTPVVVATVVAAAAAGVAGGVGLTRPGLTSGEAASVYAARLTRPHFVHLIKHVDLVHATYYAAMHVIVVLGGGVVAMRAVSLAATVLAAAVVVLLGTRLTGSAVSGGVAGLLFALCPTVDGAAKTVRSYGVVPLIAVLTVVALFWAAGWTRPRIAWPVYGVLLLITTYLHELSLLLVAAFAVTLAVLRPPRRVWLAWLGTSVVVIILASPLLYYSHREDQAVAFLNPPGVGGALLTTARTYSGPSPVALGVYAAGALAAVAAAVLARGSSSSWRAPGDRLLAVVALPIAVVPPVLLIAESYVATPLFDFRYVSYYQFAAALLVGHGLARLGSTLVAALPRPAPAAALASGAAVLGLVGIVLALVPQLHVLERLTTSRATYRDYYAVVSQIEAHRRPGDAVLYLPANARYIPDGYPQLRSLYDITLRRTPQQAGNFQGRGFREAKALQRLKAQRRVWEVRKVGRQWRTPKLLALERALRRNYRAVHRWRDYGLLLTLWVRGTPR